MRAVVADSKQCTRCGVVKPLADYAVSKRASTGTQVSCRKCQAKIRKERRDKDRKTQRKWIETNIDRVRENRKRYAAAMRLKTRQQERARYSLNPEKYRQKKIAYRAKHHEEILKRNRETMRRGRDALNNVYVVKTLKMRAADAPPTLIAMKREQLILRRMALQLKEAINESRKNTR